MVDLEPSLKPFDDTSGELLWQTELDAIPGSNMLSYGVGRKLYIALFLAQRNNVVRDRKVICSLFAADQELPQIDWSKKQGAAIMVLSID